MILTTTLLVQCLMSFAMFSPLVMAPLVLDTLGVPAIWVGFYAPFAYGCAIVSSINSGTLINHLCPWRLNLVCLAFAALGIFIFGLATPAALVAGAMILGLSYGPTTAAGASILAQTAPNNLSLRMSIRQSGVPMGSSLAGFLVPPLSEAFGWTVACTVIGAAAITAALLLVIVLHFSAHEHVREPIRGHSGKFRPLGLIFSNSRLLRLALVMVFFASLQNCFASFLSVYLVNHFKADLVFAGFVLGLSHGIAIFTRVFWGALADWIGSRRVLGLLGIAMAVASALTGLLDPGVSPLVLVTVIVIFGTTVTGWNGVTIAQATRLAPAGLAGAVAGETAVFVYAGFIAGPPLFALVAGAVDIQHAFIVAGLICAAATAIFLLGERRYSS